MTRNHFDVALLLLMTACSGEDGGEGRGFRGGKSGFVVFCSIPVYSCPDSGVPSYENDVAPILNARCNGCHGNGGQEAASKSLVNYADVKKLAPTVQSQISSCLMPPPPLAPLTPREEETVLTWLGCGAPAN